MKFQITMVVEGTEELESALKGGHFESGVAADVLEGGEVIESFEFKKLED